MSPDSSFMIPKEIKSSHSTEKKKHKQISSDKTVVTRLDKSSSLSKLSKISFPETIRSFFNDLSSWGTRSSKTLIAMMPSKPAFSEIARDLESSEASKYETKMERKKLHHRRQRISRNSRLSRNRKERKLNLEKALEQRRHQIETNETEKELSPTAIKNTSAENSEHSHHTTHENYKRNSKRYDSARKKRKRSSKKHFKDRQTSTHTKDRRKRKRLKSVSSRAEKAEQKRRRHRTSPTATSTTSSIMIMDRSSDKSDNS